MTYSLDIPESQKTVSVTGVWESGSLVWQKTGYPEEWESCLVVPLLFSTLLWVGCSHFVVTISHGMSQRWQ